MMDTDKVLVTEAIRSLLAQAIKGGGSVNAAVSAAAIARAHPGCGETAKQIAERIVAAATYARVAVEIDKSRP